ncbi:hypothetical protein A6M14_09670 [Acinetobacter sp. Ac_877]|uniref:hypothetical protein n=1 Tax=Acinetobacter portensis TaxID=1839785 RepID=UPI00128AFB05|nr:hypothetical protein [Acinetobacter portensis]MPW41736.1 hypothetical protein [Acinetobacter portensis]
MFYIFNKHSILKSWCDIEPSSADIKSRDEFFIETEERMTAAENAFLDGSEVYSDFTFRPPKPSQFHEWNGIDWMDPRSEEEKIAYKRSQYPKLKRYQFMRGMLENGYKSSDIEAQILRIEDEYTRDLTMLGFKDAGYFDRNDQSIGVVRDILGKTDLEIDEFWEYALAL